MTESQRADPSAECGTGKSRRPSLTVNALSNWTSFLLNLAAVFLLTPFIVAVVGKEGYGAWTLISSFIGYFGLLDLGIKSAMYRYVARFAAQGDRKAMNEFVNTALVVFSGIGVFIVAVSMLLSTPLTSFFDISDKLLDEFRRLVVIVGLATAVTFPGSVFSMVLQAREKFVLVNVAVIMFIIVRSVMVVVLLRAGTGVVGIGISFLVAKSVQAILFLALSLIVLPDVRYRFRGLRGHALKSLFAFGLPSIVMRVAEMLRLQLGTFVVGKWVGVAEVAYYGVAAQILRYATTFIVTGLGVLTPRFSALDGTHGVEGTRSLFLRSLTVSSILGSAVCLVAFSVGHAFIGVWLTADFSAALPVLWILSFAFAFDLSQHSSVGILFAMNKHKLYARVSIIEGAISFVIGVVLGSRIGLIGVALGTAIPLIIVKLCFQPAYVSRVLGIGPWQYARQVLPTLAAAIATGVVASLLGLVTAEASSYGHVALIAVIVLSVFAVLVVLFNGPKTIVNLFRTPPDSSSVTDAESNDA